MARASPTTNAAVVLAVGARSMGMPPWPTLTSRVDVGLTRVPVSKCAFAGHADQGAPMRDEGHDGLISLVSPGIRDSAS